MNQFEKEYYESNIFWDHGMLTDGANSIRIKKTVELIPNDVVSLTDIGCGNGVFLNYLKEVKPNLKLLGVDRSVTALNFVKTASQLGDINDLPFKSSAFDCVSCLEVIEHLPVSVYQKSLSELARISKRYIILSVPFSEKLEDSYTKCPQCKSIFNSDLHLRNYDTETFVHIFDKYGFKNVSYQTINPVQTFLGQKLYRRIFYPDQYMKWNSPICPICGFKEEISTDQVGQSQNSQKKKKGIGAAIRNIPKLVWPKKTSYYWILGLFERTSNDNNT